MVAVLGLLIGIAVAIHQELEFHKKPRKEQDRISYRFGE